MKKQGKIKVNSENIFPIIKKWLYSDKDIFLREIVSNSCDAIKKMERLNGLGEAEFKDKPRIDILLNKDEKTLKVIDNGIGMTGEEVEKYINQIAFSGAEEFINEYKDKVDAKAGIIGHFGLGFYSVFMVSDLVEIETLSYKDEAQAVHWESDGSEKFKINDGKRESRGTTVILHIGEDSEEFLDENKINQMLRKYCYFMPYEIYFGLENDESTVNLVNNTNPLWKKAPKDCTEDEYKNFYKEVFMDFNDPLFWIHLNVDYPFNLKGILYFPKQSNKLEIVPGKIKLFNNQVYIADNVEEVVPEFLMLLKGVIDCPDLPLNVSRSFLQNDKDVAKISKHITKKVADKLHSIFNMDRKQYESYWDDISPFIKFGCIKDEDFYEKIKDIILLKTINGEYFTLEEYPKDNDTIFYATDLDIQHQYIKMFKDNNANAIILDTVIDSHFISFIEYKNENIKFARVDSDISSSLKSLKGTENNNEIINKFKESIDNKDVTVKAECLKSSETPAIILISEDERRMDDLSKIYSEYEMLKGIKPNVTIVLNLENDIIKNITSMNEEICKLVCNQIYDIALINNKTLSSSEMELFINRNIELLKKISK